MADNTLHQMYCCLSCCGPFKPDVEAYHSNSLSARALYYIEGQAVRNQHEFNCSSTVQLLGEKEDCHIFARLGNPVSQAMDELYYKSLKTKWRDSDTNYNNANYAVGTILARNPAADPGTWHTILGFNSTTRCVAMWGRPQGIPQMNCLSLIHI